LRAADHQPVRVGNLSVWAFHQLHPIACPDRNGLIIGAKPVLTNLTTANGLGIGCQFDVSVRTLINRSALCDPLRISVKLNSLLNVLRRWYYRPAGIGFVVVGDPGVQAARDRVYPLPQQTISPPDQQSLGPFQVTDAFGLVWRGDRRPQFVCSMGTIFLASNDRAPPGVVDSAFAVSL